MTKIKKTSTIDILLSHGKEKENSVKKNNGSIKKPDKKINIISDKKNKITNSNFLYRKELSNIDLSEINKAYVMLRSLTGIYKQLKIISSVCGISVTELSNKIHLKWINENKSELLKDIKSFQENMF